MSLQAQTFLEKLTEGQTTVTEDFLLETYEEFKQKPLRINVDSNYKIKNFPFFNQDQTNKILRLRLEKQFESFNEFALKLELEEDFQEFLEPILTFQKRETQFFGTNFRSRISQEQPKNKGFKNDAFAGSELKSYNRFETVLNEKISIGFLLDKDAGEDSFQDFRSFYLSIENYPFVKKAVLGNYKFEHSQGLIWWGPYILTKLSSAPVLSGNRKARGISPYRSAGESNEFLGGASTFLPHDNFEITFLYSDVKRDATATDDGKVSSISVSGLHRTESEILKKDFLGEKMFGGNLTFRKANLEFGASFSQTDYSKEFDFEKSESLKLFGTNYTYDFENLSFSGETAFNQNGKNGTVNTLTLSSENFNTIWVYRRYEEGFENPHGLPFAESFLKAEEGFYWGNSVRFSTTKIHLFTDIFRSLEVSSSELLPQNGKEFSLEIEQKIHQKAKITTRLKSSFKERKITEEVAVGDFFRETEVSSETERTNLRLQFDFTPKPKIALRTRFEKLFWEVKRSGEKEDGILIYQDLKLDFHKRVSVNLRGIFFETDSFESRIYEYERDLPGVLRNVPLSGRGVRTYILTKIKLPYKTNLSFKFAKTFRTDLEEEKTGKDFVEFNESGEAEITRFPEKVIQGSGNGEFYGSSKELFSVQLDFEF
ncbi:MAG: hypothetical protein DWQ06_08525 [Calditrichaeota bacterium]|nr:MAG: hypothetical protein DWQ06_08525 [Calditrichota bacterium]